MDLNTLNIILLVLFGISEALGNIPAIKANSVYQIIETILSKLVGK